MSNGLQTNNTEMRAFVKRCAESLPFVLSPDGLEESKARMALVFSNGAAPQLAACTRESIAHAIVLSAMSGLFPGGPMPDVWLIPRRNRKKGGALEANWQISARGYTRLARRAGYQVVPTLVYKDEQFAVQKGTSPSLTHVPDVDKEQGYDDIRLGYVVVTSPDKEVAFAILRKDQIDKRRAKAQDQGIWREWPEEQSLKTLCSYAGRREMWPCDPQARHVIDADDKSVLASPPVQAPLLQADFQEAEPAAPEEDKTMTKEERWAAASGRASSSEPAPVDLAALEKRVEAAGLTSSVKGAFGALAIDWERHVGEIETRCEDAEEKRARGEANAAAITSGLYKENENG